MRALVLSAPHAALALDERPIPSPGAGEILVRVRACAVCRTDLHLLDGELPEARFPIVPGHQIAGVVEATGPGTARHAVGARVGVPWLGWACGVCPFCRAGRENLCPEARYTGCHRDGGFADYAIADARFAVALPGGYDDAAVAPLLCAGLIGWRTLGFAGEGTRLGIYGFGAAAHLVTQVARHQGRKVFAFVRPGDDAARRFALELGAAWAGPSDAPPPEPLDAALIFAPVGALVPLALRAVAPGGTVVCGGIRMSDIPSFPYELLWGERTLRSVANLTRRDAEAFMTQAERVPIRTTVQRYALEEAARALEDLRAGRITGAAVLTIS
jgi:propanol-preferring alcohol dehydrogenase